MLSEEWLLTVSFHETLWLSCVITYNSTNKYYTEKCSHLTCCETASDENQILQWTNTVITFWAQCLHEKSSIKHSGNVCMLYVISITCKKFLTFSTSQILVKEMHSMICSKHWYDACIKLHDEHGYENVQCQKIPSLMGDSRTGYTGPNISKRHNFLVMLSWPNKGKEQRSSQV